MNALRTTFQVAKNDLLGSEEGEAPFHCEAVQPPPPPPPGAQEAAMVTTTTAGENVSINQTLCKLIQNSNPSHDNYILITAYNNGRNLAVCK